MANKATNYLFGFLSGTVTGITLGLLIYFNKKEVKKLEENSDNEADESNEDENKKNVFLKNIVKSKIYQRISNLAQRESDKYK